MNILTVLHDQHRRLKACTRVLRDPQADADAARAALEKLLEFVVAHAEAEGRTFYEALCTHESSSETSRDSAFEAAEEYAIAGVLARELERTGGPGGLRPWTPETAAKARALAAVIERHIQEEENQMFILASRLFSRDELKKLGEDYCTFFFSRGL